MTRTIQITIVGLAIIVLIGVAIPNFFPPRVVVAQSACVPNLRLIQVAKSRWAEVYHKAPLDTPTEADLFGESNAVAFSKGTSFGPSTFARMPACPAEGRYILGAVSEEPRCSLAADGHSLHPGN